MQTLTIRIPKRARKGDPFTVEGYVWKDGSLKGVRPTRVALPKDLLEGGPPLEELRESLQVPADVEGLRTLGKRLYAALSKGKLRELWKSLGHNSRVYLALEDESLRDLPWELLEDDIPFAWLAQKPLMRCDRKDPPAAPALERRPLKVLLLIGIDDNDDIGARAEAGRIKRLFWQTDYAFDCVVIDAFRRNLAKPQDLQTLFTEHTPDIFHFIGHGDSSNLRIFSGSSGTTWDWNATKISAMLRNSKPAPRLAYLNACRSNTAGGALDMSSVAAAFLADGTLAVVSMQADVDGTAAKSCATTFYKTLASGATVDEALQAGRLALDQNTKDPYLPVLTVKAAVETILPKRPEIDVARDRAIQQCKFLGALESFVDRHNDRRTLITNFLLDTQLDRRCKAALLEGASKTGKTWFCWWWIRMCARQGLPAYYAQPPKAANLADVNWLEYIRAICHGDPTLGALAPGLPLHVASQFYWELDQIAKGIEAPFPPAPKGYTDSRRSLPDILDSGLAGNEIEKRVLASFHDALRNAAAGDRVLLICDEWLKNLGLGVGDFEILKNGLFDPIARDPHGPVRLMITLPGVSTAIENPYRAVSFDSSWHRVQINDFDYKDLPNLIVEYFERRYPDASTEGFEQWEADPEPVPPEDLQFFVRKFVKFSGITKALKGGR